MIREAAAAGVPRGPRGQNHPHPWTTRHTAKGWGKIGRALLEAKKAVDGVRNDLAVSERGARFARALTDLTLREVQAETFRMVRRLRPDDLLTLAERFSREDNAGYALYAPPYAPDFQRIEVFWAHAKGRVAGAWQGKTRTTGKAVELLQHVMPTVPEKSNLRNARSS